MQVTNQKPVELSPLYTANIKNQFDPIELVKNTVVKPLFQPLIPGAAVTMSHNGNTIDEDTITQRVLDCCGVHQNPTAEAWCKQVFGQTLLHFNANTPLNILSLFQTQAAVKANMPFPSPTMVYTPVSDIIPSAKGFLAGQNDIEKFFVSLAFCNRVQTLGVYFANAVAFEDFKNWLQQQIGPIAGNLPADTNQMFADFYQLNLNGLTESLILRNDDSQNNDPLSFARTLVSYLMAYCKQANPSLTGILPFDLGELICPKTLVMVNIEQHAHATGKQITDEWGIIQKSLQMKVNVMSTNKIQKLTAAMRAVKHAQSSIAAYQTIASQGGAVRSANIRFKRTAPTPGHILNIVKRLLQRMHMVNRSQNTFKSTHMTFQKPNRRDPDDFNKKGKSVSTRYYPDIHFYIDTSGSISEENYEDAIKACIMLAKKLNINVYFNSFSHYMSSCTCLKTQNRSVREIYAEFQKVPKVTGGTNFEQIWHYINNDKRRRRELSVIITDFEWHAPNYYVQHPKYLYYMPCSHVDWDKMKQDILSFANSMIINTPDIEKRILL